MRSIFLIACIFIVTGSEAVHAQKMNGGLEYKIDLNKLISSSQIVWYGIDFSKTKLTDESKLSEGQLLKEKYIPGWIALLNDRFSDEWLRGKFKKEVFISDLRSVQRMVKNMNVNEIVTFEKYSFHMDSVASFVRSYTLPQSSGIGFVLIMENLNKPARYVTGYFTFFDIESRKILYAKEMKGFPASYHGFSQWWNEGMIDLFDYFFKDYLKPLLKSKL